MNQIFKPLPHATEESTTFYYITRPCAEAPDGVQYLAYTHKGWGQTRWQDNIKGSAFSPWANAYTTQKSASNAARKFRGDVTAVTSFYSTDDGRFLRSERELVYDGQPLRNKERQQREQFFAVKEEANA